MNDVPAMIENANRNSERLKKTAKVNKSLERHNLVMDHTRQCVSSSKDMSGAMENTRIHFEVTDLFNEWSKYDIYSRGNSTPGYFMLGGDSRKWNSTNASYLNAPK